MKKVIIASIVLLSVIALVSCKDEGAKLYNVNVEVIYPDGYTFATREGIPVKMTNMLTGVETEKETDATGIVSFRVEAGTYNITSVFEDDEFAFNGILENRLIDTEGQEFEVTLMAVVKKGGFVISEVYFAG